MNTRTLEDLQALEQRLSSDVSRSRMQDQDGLSSNSPLMRNLKSVQQEIRDWKPSEPVAEAVKIEEKKIVVGSVEHMTHTLHAHHIGTSVPTPMGYGTENQNYHIHHMGVDLLDGKNPSPIHNYLMVNRDGKKEAHHFTVQAKPVKNETGYPQTSSITHDVKHVAKVM